MDGVILQCIFVLLEFGSQIFLLKEKAVALEILAGMFLNEDKNIWVKCFALQS